MLSRMKMGIDKAMAQYSTVGNGVFAHPRIVHGKGVLRAKYKTARMKKALHEVLTGGLAEESKRTGMVTSDIRLRNENVYACHT
jgi:hypothetical protein